MLNDILYVSKSLCKSFVGGPSYGNCAIAFHKCLFQAENSMTSRAYMGEVLTEIHQEMSGLYIIGQTSECTKREFNKKTSKVHAGSCKPMNKVCNENARRKKRWASKIFGRKEFIRCVQNTRV